MTKLYNVVSIDRSTNKRLVLSGAVTIAEGRAIMHKLLLEAQDLDLVLHLESATR
jgi:hypothetical protein